MANQTNLYDKGQTKHNHSHTLQILSISTTCKNFFNLLLKCLTEHNSFRDEGNWFQILPALIISYSSFAVICINRIPNVIFFRTRVLYKWTALFTVYSEIVGKGKGGERIGLISSLLSLSTTISTEQHLAGGDLQDLVVVSCYLSNYHCIPFCGYQLSYYFSVTFSYV